MRKYTQMRCYFHYSCQTEYQIVRCKGNNSYEKDIKTYKFRIRSGMWKMYIVYIYIVYVFGKLHVKDNIMYNTF